MTGKQGKKEWEQKRVKSECLLRSMDPQVSHCKGSKKKCVLKNTNWIILEV